MDWWTGKPLAELTVESIRACVQKLRELNAKPEGEDFKFLVHPLRWLLISRRCDPHYCPYFGIRLRPNWKEMYDQTFADYQGIGINGSETDDIT
jgi:hypothetical protein